MSGGGRWFQVERPGGRSLEVLVDPAPNDRPLVFHSGTPTAAVWFGQLADAAARAGRRLITYSRPGYAGSTPMPGRSVADAAADVTAILDSLGGDDFVALGWSGGGPHALACAALLPDRCTAAATVGGVAPYPTAGLDWMAGMGEDNVAEFTAALEGQQALLPFLEKWAIELGTIHGPEVAASLRSLVSEVDKRALTGEFADLLAESFRRAVSAGVAGWRDDDLAFTRPWGFDLSAIQQPVAVWQGEQDRMVPYAHGGWLAQHIPGARAHLYSDQGHLSLVAGSMDRIVMDLAGLGQRPSPVSR